MREPSSTHGLLSIVPLLFFLLTGTFLTAQSEYSITGSVTDAVTNEPLAFATILNTRDNSGTQADLDGKFTISVMGTDTLVISYVGYNSLVVPVNNRRDGFNVSLELGSSLLKELVVTGYGSAQERRDLTAPIETVNAEAIQDRPFANVAQALQGRVAGVNITQNGVPGANPTVRIRGLGSIQGSADPLYVVDGILTRDISYLGPNDIESISVLKDASSAALYGVRAANGVLIITTKRGKRRENRIEYNGYYGVQSISNELEMANADQYVTLINEKRDILGVSDPFVPVDPTVDTDWFDEILQSAPIQSHNISLTGGGENGTYAFGLGYLNQEGIVKKTGYERLNIRASGDYTIRDRVTTGFNFNIAPFRRENPGAQGGLLSAAFVAAPIVPAREADGSFADPMAYGIPDVSPNPALTLDNLNSRDVGFTGLTSAYLEGALLSDRSLKIRSTFGAEYGQTNNRTYNPFFAVSEALFDSIPDLTKSRFSSLQYYWDNTVSYDRNVGLSKFQVLAGVSLQEQRTDFLRASREGVRDFGEESLYLGLGDANSQSNSDGGSVIRGLSYFGRLFYSFNNRYLATLTVRADGSSTFPENNRWATFPSLGLGWVVSEEPFFQSNFIEFMKIRASYGQLGNNNIPQNVFTQTTSRGGFYSVVFGNNEENVRVGENITSAVAPDLRWEVVTEYNVGFEATMLDNRFNVQADYFNRTTEDALFTVLLTGASGVTGSFLSNNADVLNEGLELAAGWNDRPSDRFSYRVSANMTFQRNEVTQLKTGTIGIASGDAFNGNLATFTQEGRPIGEFYVLQTLGVFQSQEEIDAYTYTDPEGRVSRIQPNALPGDLKYADRNNDGQIDRGDYRGVGSYIPTYLFGINAGVSYAGFDLEINAFGQGGNKIFNRKIIQRFGDQNENYPAYFFDERWTAANGTNEAPSANVGGRQNLLPNDYLVEDGGFFRINTIQLGYTVPAKTLEQLGLSRLRFYVNAQNPISLFDYRGFSPEIPGGGLGSQLFQGLDTGVYPISTAYTFGINASF